MGSTLVFSMSSVVLNVSVTVLSGGVGFSPTADASTTAGKVSTAEANDGDSSEGAKTAGRELVRMFSGAGIVSVWKRGVEVVAGKTKVRVGLILLLVVKVRVTVINLE